MPAIEQTCSLDVRVDLELYPTRRKSRDKSKKFELILQELRNKTVEELKGER